MLLKADKLHVPEKGAGALSDALAEKFRIRNEKEVLGMAALATDIGLDDMINLGLEPDINPQLMDTGPLLIQSGLARLNGYAGYRGWPPSRPLSHRIRADNRARCADPCRNDLQCHGLLRGSAFDQLCAWNKSPNRLDKLRDRDNRVRRR